MHHNQSPRPGGTIVHETGITSRALSAARAKTAKSQPLSDNERQFRIFVSARNNFPSPPQHPPKPPVWHPSPHRRYWGLTDYPGDLSMNLDAAAGATRKVAWRIVPFLCLLYVFNILDRAPRHGHPLVRSMSHRIAMPRPHAPAHRGTDPPGVLAHRFPLHAWRGKCPQGKG